jgi:hypothetical protein
MHPLAEKLNTPIALTNDHEEFYPQLKISVFKLRTKEFILKCGDGKQNHDLLPE